MFLKRALPIVAGAGICLSAFAPAANAQFTSEEIVRQVVPTFDVNSGIDGVLIYEQLRNRTDFTIVIENLPPGAYTVTVGGQFRGFMSSFRSNKGLFAELAFSTRQRGDTLLLNFEPRGELIEIRSVLDDDRLYASGRLPFGVQVSENEPVEFDKVKVRQELATVDGSFADGRIDIKSSKRKAQANFTAKGLVSGVYVLKADGIPIGSLVAIGRGKGNIQLSTSPRGSQSMLPFNPTGVMYEFCRVDPEISGELLVMQGMVGNAQNPGGNLGEIGTAKEIFTPAGFDLDGEARAEIDIDPDFYQFRLELDDLPAGNYRAFVEVNGILIFLSPMDSPIVVAPDEPIEEEEMMPEPPPGVPEGEGEGEEMPEEPMLPQGVGPDNDGVQTTGVMNFTNTGRGPDGARSDENGNPFYVLFDEEQLSALIFEAFGELLDFRWQGSDIIVVDEMDRTYHLGKFPQSSIPLPEPVMDEPRAGGGPIAGPR